MPKGIKGFQKGYTPWNKGTYGFKHSEVSKNKISDAQKGANNPNYHGGKTKNLGYIFILMPEHPLCNCKGYIREHRLVVEEQIGRYLTPEEVVHHLGDKDDNRPENLMAFINDVVHQHFHKNPDNVKPEEIIFDGRKL